MAKKNIKEKMDWDELIQDYRSSGLTGEEWCQKNGHSIHKLRLQITKQNKLKNRTESVQFTPVQIESVKSGEATHITVKIGTAEIIVSEEFNQNLFKEVARSLLSIC